MAVVSKVARKELTIAKRSRLWTLYYEDYFATKIFRKTGVPRTTITTFIKRQTLASTITFKSKPRSGAKDKLNPRAQRRLVRTACAEPRISLKSLATASKSGKRLNYHTVAIILKSFGKAKRRPRKKPFLTPLHKQKRRFHCRDERAMKRNNRRVC
jgi:hypothetical protein